MTRPASHKPPSFEEININHAHENALAALPWVGREGARKIIHRRPFKSWEDLKRVPGFTETMVHQIRGTGAKLLPKKTRGKKTGRK